MTLLQTRVEDKTARDFARVAEARDHTPYSYLQELVATAAAAAEKGTPWKGHAERMARLPHPALKHNTVAHDRQEADER